MQLINRLLLFFLLRLLPSVPLVTVQCNASLSAMDDVVESPDPASTSSFSPLECTYSITVYAGYGVEIQVMGFIPFESVNSREHISSVQESNLMLCLICKIL